MINPLRGEIEARLDGKPYNLCLTLGALASLEKALDVESLAGLSDKFANGNLSANELVLILEAGLFGGGNDVASLDVATMKVDGSISGYVDIAARLLAATFTPQTQSTSG